MKWTSYDDSDFMKQTVHTLQCDSDSPYHQVNVFSETVNNGYRKLVRHTVAVRAAAYGETLYEHVMPFGTKIKAARERAIELARKANADGVAKFIL